MFSVRIRAFALAAALLLISAAVAGGASGSFSLEQVLSSPFPSNLIASPTGNRFAWVANAQGVRNIWVAESSGRGAYQSRQVTAYTDDDGQEIAELAWTPDGKAIVYARGGDFENGGGDPNPASAAAGVSQDIWVVALDGTAPRKLTEGRAPAVSPHGGQVAYLLKNQVWAIALTDGAKPEQWIHDIGRSAELLWSPDGSKLAFVTERHEHSFVAVYDPAAHSIRYMDPGVDGDSSPAWSPDSRSVAFLRIPSNHLDIVFGPKRTAEPWSIRVADAATGQGREVWRATAGQGSAYHGIVSEQQVYWTAANTLVFPWEVDGWNHLYAVPAAGGKARPLTPGDFEVEFVALDPARTELLIGTNQGDIDRRHLWSEKVNADHPVPVTSGEGIEVYPAVSSDGATVALFHSDATHPMRPATVGAAGEIRDLAPQTMPADFPSASLTPPKQVIFAAADGMQIHGQLFLPPNAGDGARHPALVFFHGGSRREMLLGFHYMGYYHNAYAMNQYLANRGYVVLAVNYRSGIGYGLDFREALNYGAAGASEFNDVLGAGLYLRGRSDVDGKKIGLWGGSYGGYLTALGLARASDLFACGVDLHGVHDWNLEIDNFVPTYDPQSRPDTARLAWESSPLSSIKTWRSPVLLIQGDDDRNVPFTETIRLTEALREQGVEYKLLIFPNEIHDFLLQRSWLAAYHAASDFFDAHLMR